MHHTVAGDADAVAPLQAVAIGQEARMQLAVDYQHRPGLGGEIGFRIRRQIGCGFQHASLCTLQIKHAVRQKVKIAPAAPGAERRTLHPIFNVEADGRIVGMIHAAIHGEDAEHVLPPQGRRQVGETAVSLPGDMVAVINADGVPCRIETADGVAPARMVDGLAEIRLPTGLRGKWQQQRQQRLCQFLHR
ncbi:hypothetical protein D3C78_1188130 [compost metagenome]